MSARVPAIIVVSVVATRRMIGPMVLSVALMVRSGIAVPAAPSDQAANQSTGDKRSSAISAMTSVPAVVAAASMPSTSIMATMSAAMVASPVAYVM